MEAAVAAREQEIHEGKFAPSIVGRDFVVRKGLAHCLGSLEDMILAHSLGPSESEMIAESFQILAAPACREMLTS